MLTFIINSQDKIMQTKGKESAAKQTNKLSDILVFLYRISAFQPCQAQIPRTSGQYSQYTLANPWGRSPLIAGITRSAGKEA